MTPDDEKRIAEAYLSGSRRVVAICEEFQINRSTLYWVLRRLGHAPNRRRK